ncbi:MAG TPA: FtsQ-type POTRA domain-containing protein [Candidatus Kapabacteria bacterium]|nr:FtsQ-type POTRA domain-containing protein [Candidatus Kapabacteria bacterium]
MKKLKISNISTPVLLIIMAMILIIIAFLYIASTKWSDNTIVTEVTVKGNNFVKEQEIVNIIKGYVINQPKKYIKLDSVSKLILKNNYILTANANYGLNGELQIEVAEREPIAYVVDKSGDLKIVDKYSFIFENYSVPKNLNLPIIYLNKENYDKYSLRNTLEFISVLSTKEQSFNDYIMDFTTDDDSRVIRATGKLYNLKLLFSSLVEPEKQFNKLVYFIGNYEFTNANQLSYLDLRWEQKVLIGRKI